jgi:copper transport protein
VTIVLAAAPGASAHAVLQQTEPGNDAVLDASPAEVALRFSEPVETGLGALRVLDESGAEVNAGSLTRPDPSSVAVALEPDLPRGTYTVAWRVTSADSHPVFGAFVFHVGEPGANPAGVVEQALAAGETPRSISIAFTTVRFVSLALLLLAVGGTAALALVLGEAGERPRRRLYGVLAVAAVGFALASLAGIVLQGAESAGVGIGEAARWSVVESVLETQFGQVWLARAVLALGLAALALALRAGRGPSWALDLALVLCVGLVVSPAASGHASTEGALAFVMDVVHVQAAAVWVGGLAFVFLALLWSGAERWRLAGTAVPRFSTMAVVSVAALLVAGIVNGYLQIRSWSGLWETTYGRLVLAKAALLLPILALAAWNNRRAVPRLKAGIASAFERRRFLQTVGAELALVVAVVAVTAVLVSEPPARAVTNPSGPYAETTELGDLLLNLVVDPALAGPNAIHLYLLTQNGQPADVAEVDVAATLAAAGIGPLRLEARRIAPGHYVVSGAPLTLAGDWQVRVDARRGEFEALSAELVVPIRKEQ